MRRRGEDAAAIRIVATTLGDLLLCACDRAPDKTAFVFPGTRLTYRQFADRAMRRARALWALGVRPRQHVGILMPSGIELLEALFAVAMCGAVSVLLNARYRAHELAYVIENADLVALLTTTDAREHADLPERLREAFPALDAGQDPHALSLADAPKLRWIVGHGASPEPWCIGGAGFDAGADSVDPAIIHRARVCVRVRDVGLILYTSGTSSNPKGCLITHEAITREANNIARYRWELAEADVTWSPMPLYHIAALTAALAAVDVAGTFVGVPHFDAGESLRQIEEEGATLLFVVFETFLQAMAEHPDFAAANLDSVRLMNSCFAMMPHALAAKYREKVPEALQCGTFGMTETSGIVSTGGYGMERELGFSRLGFPLAGIEVKNIDRVSGEEVPCGQMGETLVRGYSLFNGYYRDPAKTAEALDGDGWYHSGDICSTDGNGHLLFHGRFKDMLKVGGENVAAAEVEAILARHPGVKLAQVVGIPDRRLSEVPAAFIERHTGADATEADLIAFVQQRLASFKVPRYVRFVDAWPTSIAKIQKFRLRRQLMDELGISE